MFKLSLFTLGLILGSSAFAATGTGHAQAELSNPLTVTNSRDVNFGVIAIDPAAGTQTLSMDARTYLITCPATYVCSGSTDAGIILITGLPNTPINLDVTGSTAVLDDGAGNQLIFDPFFADEREARSDAPLNETGTQTFAVGGTIDFAGTETAGIYTSANGSGYTVTVNY